MARRKPQPISLETFVVVHAGLTRVRNLVALYDHLIDTVEDSAETPTSDLLRAATVLLHAVLEEFVRYVASRTLPLAGANELSKVPLSGFQRGAKFTLGDLVPFRGSEIDVVLRRSVEEDLAKRSFGSLAQILSVLEAGSVRVRKSRIRAKTLDGLIRRRHRIVHEADEVPERRPHSHVPRAISRRQVYAWIRTVEQFIEEVDRGWRSGRWA